MRACTDYRERNFYSVLVSGIYFEERRKVRRAGGWVQYLLLYLRGFTIAVWEVILVVTSDWKKRKKGGRLPGEELGLRSETQDGGSSLIGA